MKIEIDVAQVQDYSTQFTNKSQELEQLRQNANNMANQLAAAWRGQRANAFQGDWQQMTPQIQNAIQVLQQAAQLLQRAATDFGAADSAR